MRDPQCLADAVDFETFVGVQFLRRDNPDFLSSQGGDDIEDRLIRGTGHADGCPVS